MRTPRQDLRHDEQLWCDLTTARWVSDDTLYGRGVLVLRANSQALNFMYRN